MNVMSLHTPEADTDVVISSFAMASVGTDNERPICATLTYHSSEPFSVRASFSVAGAAVVHWILARDLLREGVALPTGLGDVRIFPGDDGFLVELRSDNGCAFLYGPIDPLVDFVGRIYALVPDGAEQEHFSIEAELQRLLTLPIDTNRHSSDST
jgi:hypothetical protein